MRAATSRVTSLDLERSRRRRAEPADAANADDAGHYSSGDAEEAVLCAMLMEEPATLRASEILDDTMFFRENNRKAFRAMVSLLQRGDAIDSVTLIEELTQRGDFETIGGKDYLLSWNDAVPTAANVEYHAKIVREKWERRQLRRIGEQMISESAESLSPSDILSAHREVLASLSFDLSATDDDALPLAACAFTVPPATPIEWLIVHFLPAGEFALWVGVDGHFKSTLALVAACAVAGGYRLFGHFATETAGAVLIVSAEDPLPVIIRRVEAICKGHGWDLERVLRNLHIITQAEVSLSDAAWQARLKSEVIRLNAKLVILDPFAELVSGNENDNSEMRPVVKEIRKLLAPTGATVVVVHHANKSLDRPKIDRIRGATAIRAASRATYFIEEGFDSDVSIECLKFSRASKPKPFVVRRVSEFQAEHPDVWERVRFDYVSTQEAALDRAESFVLEQIENERLSTSQLKDAAKGTGVSGADIAKALKVLAMRKRIDFEPGPKGAKLWGYCLPDESRQPRQPQFEADLSLPGKQSPCPATTPTGSACLPIPIRVGSMAGERAL